MTTPVGLVPLHVVKSVHDQLDPAPAGERRPALHLTEVERRAVAVLVTGGDAGVVAHVADRAAALASDDGAAVLRRSLAKATAIAEAQMQEFGVLLAEAVRRRDGEAVRMLNKALTGATQRFRTLADQLLATHQGGRRAVVQVLGQAGAQVNVSAGR